MPSQCPMLRLAPETLYHILSYLLPFEIEHVARTLNTTLTPLCVPLLQKRCAVVRNARRMTSYFGALPPLPSDLFEQVYNAAGLASKGTFAALDLPAERRFIALDAFDLDDDLRWLVPLGEPHRAKYCPDGLPGAPTKLVMAELKAQARALGLRLPTSLIRFFGEREMQVRAPPACDSDHPFLLGPLVRLVGVGPSTSEDPAFRAYGLTFREDQQGCGYWNLYVDTLGGECVIASDCGFDLEPFDDEGRRAKNEALLNETERSLRIPTLDISSWDFLLEATSFEGYLVTMLAEDWAYGWLEEDPDEVPIPHPLEDFTLKVFAKENRAQS